MYSIDSLSKQFVRNVVGAALAALIIAVVAMWVHIVKLNTKIEEAAARVAEIERRCGEEKDRLRQEQIKILNLSSERWEKFLKNKK